MYAIDTYKDLCIDIDICKMNIERLCSEVKIHQRDLAGPGEVGCQQYSDMPKGSKRDPFYVDSVIEMARIDAKLEKQRILLKGMMEQKEYMSIKLKGLTGLPYKVIYKKDVEGKSGIRIAQELGINEKTVYRILARIKRKNKMKVG